MGNLIQQAFAGDYQTGREDSLDIDSVAYQVWTFAIKQIQLLR